VQIRAYLRDKETLVYANSLNNEMKLFTLRNIFFLTSRLFSILLILK